MRFGARITCIRFASISFQVREGAGIVQRMHKCKMSYEFFVKRRLTSASLVVNCAQAPKVPLSFVWQGNQREDNDERQDHQAD
jgi:hypothetical protein